MSIHGCTLTLLVLIVASFGTASAASVEVLNRFSKDLKGLEGAFEQTVFDDRGGEREQSQGRIALALPRLFRWEYQTPFPQLIVADGDHVWIFDPDLEQVTVRKQALEEQSSPLAVLIDPAELERQFKTKDMGASEGLDWVQLTPRQAEGAFSEARIGFDGADLSRMVLVDSLGQRTEIVFSDWTRNPDFKADTFRFVPPPGADVVGEKIDEAQVYPIN
ncbi:MAG: outer membrane lipoprotein chaperone LolA [Pseudomarimonas sp.]